MPSLPPALFATIAHKRRLSLVGKKNFRDLVHAWIERRYFERLLQRRRRTRVLTHGFVIVDACPLGVHRHFRAVDAAMQARRGKARMMGGIPPGGVRSYGDQFM